MSRTPRRIVSVGHSYCIGLNRRLPDAMARVGAGKWEVTAVAPSFFHADLRPVALERVAGESLHVEPVDARLSRYIHVMHYAPRLRALLRGPWDVVHCWEEPYIVAGAQVAHHAPADAALVYSTFQNIPKRYPPPFQWIERFSMRRADGWIAAATTVEETLAPRPGYVGVPYRVIPLGVDVEHFRPDPEAGARVRRELGWDEQGAPVVGYLGRFVPAKGLSMLTGVLDRTPGPWRALFVGGGPLESELRQWAGRHGDRVRVVTGVRHPEVPAYLNAMDLLCAPSQTTPQWREQLGRMLIEAFACGVPVLGSDSGEIPYVVDDAGLIAAEADPVDWERQLGRLVSDDALRRELGARGVERARAVFAWEHVARQHLDFFGDLLDARP